MFWIPGKCLLVHVLGQYRGVNMAKPPRAGRTQPELSQQNLVC